MPAVAVHNHLDAAHLCHYVWTSRQFRDRGFPRSEYLIAPPGVRSDSDRPAEVVEYDRRVRKGLREVGQLRDLRVVDPAFEAQSVGAQIPLRIP